MSIAITRYFGKEVYGEYSYFIWLGGVLALIASFGLQQTVMKYLPKYYFANEGNPEKFLKKLLTIQILGAIGITLLCTFFTTNFAGIINFNDLEKNSLLIITFISIIPLSLNTLVSSSLSAMQKFETLSKTYIGTSIINLILVLMLIFTEQQIIHFLWLYCTLSWLFAIYLVWQTLSTLKKNRGNNTEKPSQQTPKENLAVYSAYAYVSTLSTQVVWERSELFFLGMFSNSSQIALYTLSYSLAVLFISIWGPLNGVMNATLSEVVATEKKDKLLMITKHGTKYLAILMLPLSLLASLFLKDVITLFYGTSFIEAANLFPLLVISHIIAIIITPAGSIPMLKNEMKKSMIYSLSTAVINIALDLYLIVKYQAVGAMLANVISQFFSIGLSLINAKKYQLGIFNKHMVQIFIINIILGGVFFFISPYNLIIRLLAATIGILLYTYATLQTAFNQDDLRILQNIQNSLPESLKKIAAWAIAKIKTSTAQ